MKSNELDNRVVELETRIAFQEESIGDLSAVIVRQQAELDKMAQQMQRLTSRLANFEEFGAEGSEPEPPPPHY